MKVGPYALDVIVDGEALAEDVPEATAGEGWVEAVRGKEFSLRLANAGAAKVVAVTSVDGLSVMTGQPASYGCSGYVIGRGEEVVVPGWRLDTGSVARFQFGTVSQGYARQMGHPVRNVGVIAAAFFTEDRRVAAAREIAADVQACWADPKGSNTVEEPHDYVRRRAAERAAAWNDAAAAGDTDGAWFVAVRKLMIWNAAADRAESQRIYDALVGGVVALLRLAAERGHALSQYSLGWCHEHDVGVICGAGLFRRLFGNRRADLRQQAERWYELAAAQRLPAAVRLLRQMRKSVVDEGQAKFSAAGEEDVAGFADKAAEAAYQRSKGIGKKTLTERARENLEEKYRQLTRTYEHLDTSDPEQAIAPTQPERHRRPSPKHTEDVSVVFGRRAVHRVIKMEFVRSSPQVPDAEIRIRYDTAEGLRKRQGGCPEPPGWHEGGADAYTSS